MTKSLASRTMTLSFPNRSRSFDEARSRVRFWGYDSALEIAFFVEGAALRKLVPRMGDAEDGFLKAFDEVRERIHQVADQVYACGRKDIYSYVLTSEDF